MKCESKNCEDDATFEIKNFRKKEQLFLCDLHFWQFCAIMIKAYKKLGIGIKEIDEMIREW